MTYTFIRDTASHTRYSIVPSLDEKANCSSSVLTRSAFQRCRPRDFALVRPRKRYGKHPTFGELSHRKFFAPCRKFCVAFAPILSRTLRDKPS